MGQCHFSGARPRPSDWYLECIHGRGFTPGSFTVLLSVVRTSFLFIAFVRSTSQEPLGTLTTCLLAVNQTSPTYDSRNSPAHERGGWARSWKGAEKMQRYLNVRTLGLAALMAVAVLAVYPDAIRFLPFLVLAACPFMMFLMHGHAGHSGHQTTTRTRPEFGEYGCPMHAEVRSTFAGDCPVCGMELEATTSASSGRR